MISFLALLHKSKNNNLSHGYRLIVRSTQIVNERMVQMCFEYRAKNFEKCEVPCLVLKWTFLVLNKICTEIGQNLVLFGFG